MISDNLYDLLSSRGSHSFLCINTGNSLRHLADQAWFLIFRFLLATYAYESLAVKYPSGTRAQDAFCTSCYVAYSLAAVEASKKSFETPKQTKKLALRCKHGPIIRQQRPMDD